MEKTLGDKIRELREKKDLSLREFAKELGNISAAHISDIELGRRYPSSELLAKIAALLGVTEEDLNRYDSRPPVADLKRISGRDPQFGFALRKLVDKHVTAEELLNLTRRKPDREKGK